MIMVMSKVLGIDGFNALIAYRYITLLTYIILIISVLQIFLALKTERFK